MARSAAPIDVLGLDRFVAAKFMQAATKFSNVSSTTHLTKAIGNQTKLFEMLVLDDEQIDELALTGQSGDLKLDEIGDSDQYKAIPLDLAAV